MDDDGVQGLRHRLGAAGEDGGAAPDEPRSGLAALVAGRWSLHPAAALAALVLVAAVVVLLVLRAVAAAPAAPVPEPAVAIPARTGAAASTPSAPSGPPPTTAPTATTATTGATGATAAAAGFPAAASAAPGASAGQATGASSPTGPAVVVVDVSGHVVVPGVVRLPAGARVEDALVAAGGPTRDADLARVNRARVLADGEQVVVPAPGEPLPAVQAPPPAAPAAAATAAGTGTVAAASAAPSGPVDLNAASLAELDALPGVGPVLAQRVLDWRAAHGRFASVDELGEVSGVGEVTMARLRPLVAVGPG